MHAGLNAAMSATGSALELHSHKTGSFSHKLQQTVADLGRLRSMVYGDVGSSGGSGGGGGPEGGGPAMVRNDLQG